MKTIEIVHSLDNYLKENNKEGKFIIRKRVEASAIVASLKTYILELYYINKSTHKILETKTVSSSKSEDLNITIACEELLSKIFSNWESIKNGIQ